MEYYNIKNLYINEICLLDKDIVLVEPMHRIESFDIVSINDKEIIKKDIYKYTSLYNNCNVSYYDMENKLIDQILFFVDKKNNKEYRYNSTVKIIGGIKVSDYVKNNVGYISCGELFHLTNQYIKQKRLK